MWPEVDGCDPFHKYGIFEEIGKPVNSWWLMGHESSGDVVEIAGKVQGIELGVRVVAIGQGAQAEYARIPLSSELGCFDRAAGDQLC